jgi:hypothetical protein
MPNHKNKLGDTTPKQNGAKKPTKAVASIPGLNPQCTFTQGIADEICRRMVMGVPLSQICRTDPTMPPEATVRGWLLIPALKCWLDQYSAAHEMMMDKVAEECLEISDDGRNDWVEREIRNQDGKVIAKELVLNTEHINRSRLRVDTRKWLLSKLSNKYGDKLDLNVGGQPNGAPIKHVLLAATVTPTEAAKAYAEMIEGS